MSELIPVDLLITARWIIPVIPENTVLEQHTLAIDKGLIVALLPSEEIKARYTLRSDGAEHDLGEHVLMPGLINCHSHTAMSLLKGYADDTALQTWLEEHIWPAEGQHVSESFVADGTQLAMAEMIKTGTTCFADMYFYPEVAAKVCAEAGMRSQITVPVLDFPTNWGSGPDEYLAKGEAVFEAYQDNDLITIGYGPHAPYTVSDDAFNKLVKKAEQWQAPIQIHVHETAFEVEQAIKDTGKRPTERLRDLGVLSSRTQCVHMTQIDDTDIDVLQSTGAHVMHCPESNLKLASGFCPVDRLQNAGVNVALGTDGSASNNDLDMFGEMRSAAILAKAVAGNPEALSAHKALSMATLNGAKALGIDALVGSLEVGKQADLTAMSMTALGMLPLYNPVSQLVYCNNSHNVSHVWVKGRNLLHEGRLTTLDEQEIVAKALAWGDTISAQTQTD